MTSLNRWKLASAVFAAIAGYALFLRGPSQDTPAAEAATTTRSGALPASLRRPLRISAAQAGISKADLVEHLLAAKSLKDVRLLADKLGMVGDDDAIRDVLPLLSDPRGGVPEAILTAIGRIGTEHAVEVLAERTRDDRISVRHAAVLALGQTRSEEAESLLIQIARDPADATRNSALTALGQLGTDRATETLIGLAGSSDSSIASTAVLALGATDNQAADAALRKLIDSSDVRVSNAAMSAIDNIDSDLLARLGKIAKSGDPMRAPTALAALGKAGTAGLPVLREAALHGNYNMRWAAINAIGQIGGPDAVKTLGNILDAGDRSSAGEAARALANIGGPDARDLLISSALSDRAQITGAIDQLARLDGDDVDAALLKIIKDGNNTARRAALPRLLRTGNEDALRVAVDMATRGSRSDRYQAMNLLANTPTPAAWDALVDIAGKVHGQARVSALELLAQHRPSDQAVETLLGDSLFSGRRTEAQYAAGVLGRVGTEQARQMLLSALTGDDKNLSVAAANALGQNATDPAVKSALLAAARENPKIRGQLMQQLVRLGAPEGLRLAEDMLSSTHRTGDASSIIYALAQNGSEGAKRIIERALTSSDTNVRVAAISSLGQSPDDRSTAQLVRLVRDGDARVRAVALSTLGQIGSETAKRALIDATQGGKAADRIAALGALASIDDQDASEQIARLMRDSDTSVARVAISSAYSGGAEIDRALLSIVNDSGADDALRRAAAGQLRGRGTDLDDSTEQVVTKLAGPAPEYGGYGYGGGYGAYDEIM